MNVYEVFFLIQFLAIIVILGYKLFNVLSGGQYVDLRYAIMAFVGFFVFWGIGFFTLLTNPVMDAFYSVMFKFETYFIALNALFFFIEIVFYLRDRTTQEVRAHMSSLERSK